MTGTVDTGFDANDLCDGDPHFEISRDGNLSLTAAGTSVTGVDGLVVANSNLVAGTNVVFGGGVGAHTIIMPTVPPDGISLNAYMRFTPGVTASGFTVSITGHPIRIVIGEIFAGKFTELRALPPESSLELIPIAVPMEGEYGGLALDRGAAPARRYGGRIYVNDTTADLVYAWYLACRNNSLPSVIVPFPSRDPWVVQWSQFNMNPVEVDLSSSAAWVLDVEWQELPRFRYPVEP